ncbi:sulfite exporter TauE/SafE family protein [Vineibacter terrae]|uniref:Probable membrane transporter protein n=1 Tax=Vineibacter terrae TaxID=2586908 RepID=A0A5C8PRH0_9HYPH|nr:sulfite exporter TauE/SafE family protein [Vineibacter terrae]TXL78123.1 sulfite exporter TauE/SafE family protein [Vineibacter terrae]
MIDSVIAYIAALFAATGFWIPAVVVLVAGLMRGFAGFGSAMLMAPVFAVLFGPTDMIATVVAIELAVSLQLFPSARGDCDWRIVGPMSVVVCLAMPLGAWLLASVDKGLIVKTVSGIIVVFVLIMASGIRYRGERSVGAGMVVGALSGVMMATTSVGGPPVLMYLLAGNDPPARHRANIITYYMATQVPLIGIMFWYGLAGVGSIVRGLVLLPLMLVGAWIGRLLFNPRDERLYRSVALAILFGAGAFGLLRDLIIR